MEKMGFASKVIDWIMMCVIVTTMSYSISLNGDIVGLISLVRGLRLPFLLIYLFFMQRACQPWLGKLRSLELFIDVVFVGDYQVFHIYVVDNSFFFFHLCCDIELIDKDSLL